MLNTALTVKAGSPGSHSNKGWETFTEQVLRVVDKYGGANLPRNESDSSLGRPGFGRGVVFMAWGAWAQKRVAGLDKARQIFPHITTRSDDVSTLLFRPNTSF